MASHRPDRRLAATTGRRLSSQPNHVPACLHFYRDDRTGELSQHALSDAAEHAGTDSSPGASPYHHDIDAVTDDEVGDDLFGFAVPQLDVDTRPAT